MRRLSFFLRSRWILLGVLLAGSAAISLRSLPVLLLSSGDQVAVLRIVRPGDNFHLGFLHSLARSDVWDRFIIDAQHRIVLVETIFQGQGTGIPYGTAEGETLIREGDWFRLTGRQRLIPDIHWRVGAEWRNRFRFGSEPEINLSELMGDCLLYVRVEKVPVIIWLWTHARAPKP